MRSRKLNWKQALKKAKLVADKAEALQSVKAREVAKSLDKETTKTSSTKNSLISIDQAREA